MARRLGISEAQAEQGLAALPAAGSSQKKLQRAPRPDERAIEHADGIPDLRLRERLYPDLDLARRSLDADPVKKCDFSSITMAIDPKRLGEAKVFIKNSFVDGLRRCVP